VRTSLPLVQIEARLARLRGVIGLGAGLAALMGLGLGWFVTRRYTTPLISMTGMAEEIARGGRGQMAVRGTDDEIDRLAHAVHVFVFVVRIVNSGVLVSHGRLVWISTSARRRPVCAPGAARRAHATIRDAPPRRA
jgi:hypothetical protein